MLLRSIWNPPICFAQNINHYSHILQYIVIVVLFNKLLLSRFVITLDLFLSIQLRRKTSNDLIPSFPLKTRGDNRCDNLLLDSLSFFSIWVFFQVHSRFTGQQRKKEAIYLTPLYHFHPLHRHLDIVWAITAESSPLYIASSQTQTQTLSASC